MAEDSSAYEMYGASAPIQNEIVATADTYTISDDIWYSPEVTKAGSAGVGDGKAWYTGINDLLGQVKQTVDWGLSVNREFADKTVQVVKANDTVRRDIEQAKVATRAVSEGTPNMVREPSFNMRSLIVPALGILTAVIAWKAVKGAK